MPIYEYECGGCGKVFEVLQKTSDPAPGKHDCGSTDLHRIMSRSSFVLKGSGCYLTDYARKGQNRGDDKADGKADGKGDKKDGGGTKDSGNTSGEGGKDSEPAKAVAAAADAGAA